MPKQCCMSKMNIIPEGDHDDGSASADHAEHRYIRYLDTTLEVHARRAFVDCNERNAKHVCLQYASCNGHIHMTGDVPLQQISAEALSSGACVTGEVSRSFLDKFMGNDGEASAPSVLGSQH